MARPSERHRELIYTLAADWKRICPPHTTSVACTNRRRTLF